MAVGVVEVNAAIVFGATLHSAAVAFQVFLPLFVVPPIQAESHMDHVVARIDVRAFGDMEQGHYLPIRAPEKGLAGVFAVIVSAEFNFLSRMRASLMKMPSGNRSRYAS